MAYLFSIVELAAESGEAARFFANDRPQDAYDMMFLEEAKDFFSKIAQDQRVRVSIHTYEYCPGAGIPAGNPSSAPWPARAGCGCRSGFRPGATLLSGSIPSVSPCLSGWSRMFSAI